jgi:hypothetical protein
MTSKNKTDICDKFCKGCEEYTDKLDNWGTDGIDLCEECNENYENTTGYCSIQCSLGWGCDGSC